jgi:gliding motility-associated-like protein
VLYVRESFVTIEDTAYVNCNTAYFTAPASGGFPPYYYTWTGDAGLSSTLPAFSYTYSVSGTYQYIVKVKDAYGCFDQDTGYVTINVDKPLEETGIVDTVICQFDTLVVTYPGDTSGGLQVLWDFGSGASPKTVTGKGPHRVSWNLPGTKIIKLTLKRGTCNYVVYDTIQVLAAPVVDAGPSRTLCAFRGLDTLRAQVISGGGTNCQFQWWPATGLSNPNVQNPIVYPDTTRTYYVRARCNGCWSEPDSVKITVLPAPQATVPKPIYYYCIGTQGVQIQANVSGGTAPLFYQWIPSYALSNPNITNPMAFPPVDTIYRFVATDRNGCPSDTVSVKVIAAPRPLAYAGKDTAICADGPGVFLQGVGIDTFGFGSFQYQWIPSTGLSNPNIANPYAKPDSTTIYTLIVTNNYTGCSSDPTDTLSTVVVKVIPKPIADAGPPSIEVCYQDSVQLGDVSMGSMPGYTYEWSPGVGLNDSTLPRPMASPPHTQVYYLRVFNQGCASDVDSIRVIVKPYPRVAIIPGPYEICFGDSVQIRTQTTIHSGLYSGPIHYQWTPANLMSDPTVSDPWVTPNDTTLLKVYAAIPGCPLILQDSTVVIVDFRPQIEIDSLSVMWPITICKGDSVQLPVTVSGIEPYTIQWQPATTVSDPSLPSPLVFPDQTTTYTVMAQYKHCKVKDSLTVYVEGGFSVELTADRSYVCDGDTVRLWAQGGIGNPDFVWSPSVLQWTYLTPTLAEAIAIPTDTTTFIVTAIEGKAQCAKSDSITILWYPKVKAQFEAVPVRGCDTLKVTFRNLSQGDQYWHWDFGDGTISNEKDPVHVYTQPGTYFAQLTVNRNYICPDSSVLRVPIRVFPVPSLEVKSEPTGIPVQIGLPDAYVSFQVKNTTGVPLKLYFWDFGDGTYSETPNPTHRYHFPGEFYVTLTVVDENDCEQTLRYGPIVVADPYFETPNVFTPNGDGINDLYYFTYEGTASFGAEIYDRFGNLVFRTSNPKEGWNGRILNDGPEAMEGTYFYVVRIGSAVYRGQITLIR